MWFMLSVILVAILHVLDLLSILFAVKLLSYNPVELGLVSALWTLSLVLGSRFYGKRADRGLFRDTLSMSLASAIIYSILMVLSLRTGSKPLLAVAYAFHAQMYSSVRVTISTLMLEYFDYREWRNISLRYATGIYFVEGMILIGLSQVGFQSVVSNVAFTLVPLLILPVALMINLPRMDFMIERSLFRVDRLLNKTLMNIRNVVFTTPLIHDSFDISEAREVGLGGIVLGITGFVFSNEVFFTILPFILVNSCGFSLEVIIAMYGFGKFVSSLLIALVFRSASRSGLAIGITARSLALITIYLYSSNPMVIVLGLVVIYTSGLAINTTLYSLYNEATYGYGVYRYSILYETLSLIGSIASGFLYKTCGLLLLPLAVIVKLLSSSRLLSSR